MSEQTSYRWRNQFGGLKAHDAKRLRQLERENATLKRLLAEAEGGKTLTNAGPTIGGHVIGKRVVSRC